MAFETISNKLNSFHNIWFKTREIIGHAMQVNIWLNVTAQELIFMKFKFILIGLQLFISSFKTWKFWGVVQNMNPVQQ